MRFHFIIVFVLVVSLKARSAVYWGSPGLVCPLNSDMVNCDFLGEVSNSRECRRKAISGKYPEFSSVRAQALYEDINGDLWNTTNTIICCYGCL